MITCEKTINIIITWRSYYESEAGLHTRPYGFDLGGRERDCVPESGTTGMVSSTKLDLQECFVPQRYHQEKWNHWKKKEKWWNFSGEVLSIVDLFYQTDDLGYVYYFFSRSREQLLRYTLGWGQHRRDQQWAYGVSEPMPKATQRLESKYRPAP